MAKKYDIYSVKGIYFNSRKVPLGSLRSGQGILIVAGQSHTQTDEEFLLTVSSVRNVTGGNSKEVTGITRVDGMDVQARVWLARKGTVAFGIDRKHFRQQKEQFRKRI